MVDKQTKAIIVPDRLALEDHEVGWLTGKLTYSLIERQGNR